LPNKPIGIFGGTFDPVHYGHLHSAWALLEYLQLDHIRLIPCHIPPHREQAQASTPDRLSMLEYATESVSKLVVDNREAMREGPSYMVETLTSLRADFPEQLLCLLLGMDAFAVLTQWHRWESLIDLAHIVVIERPAAARPTDPRLTRLCEQHAVDSADAINDKLYGNLLFIKNFMQLDISASEIRKQLQAGHTPRYLLPDAVLDYIETQQLYRGEHA